MVRHNVLLLIHLIVENSGDSVRMRGAAFQSAMTALERASLVSPRKDTPARKPSLPAESLLHTLRVMIVLV